MGRGSGYEPSPALGLRGVSPQDLASPVDGHISIVRPDPPRAFAVSFVFQAEVDKLDGDAVFLCEFTIEYPGIHFLVPWLGLKDELNGLNIMQNSVLIKRKMQ